VISSSDKSSERNLSCFFDPGGWSIYRVKNPSPQIHILESLGRACARKGSSKVTRKKYIESEKFIRQDIISMHYCSMLQYPLENV
jgi:hypothetical protein